MPVSLASTGAATTHGAVVPIAYATGTGSSGTVTFSSIPQGYQDLFLVCYMRLTGNNTYAGFRFNGDTGSNYSRTCLYGDGASAASFRDTNGTAMNAFDGIAGANNTANIYTAAETYILNYANTSTNKTIIARHACDVNGSGFTEVSVGLWRSTSAITSLSIIANATNFTTASTFALYGIRSVNQ